MATIKHVRSRIALIATLVPEAWDVLHHPGSAFISDHYLELMVAETVRDISRSLTDKTQAKAAADLSITMAKQATHGLVNGWEDGDPICPPFPWEKFRDRFPPVGPVPVPWPGPWPGPEMSFEGGLQVQPVQALDQLELVSALVSLSALTYSKEANAGLVRIAGTVARGISSKLADEVDPCGTVPRKLRRKPPVGPGVGPRQVAGVGN